MEREVCQDTARGPTVGASRGRVTSAAQSTRYQPGRVRVEAEGHEERVGVTTLGETSARTLTRWSDPVSGS